MPTCGHDEFIPENIFYRLAMKAKNEAAEAFQAKIADEVIPSIRKHGAYMTPETIEAAILNPDTLIRLATALKEEQDKRKALEAVNSTLTVDNTIMKPNVQEGLFGLKEQYNEKTKWSGMQMLITPKGRETFRLLYVKIA